MKSIRQHKKVAAIFLILLTGVFICMLNAGDLDPPGPPGSTMKTLDEVEPRIPIPKSDTPAATFTINQSGSYYLTGDRHCERNGIDLRADNVTIDLMGYSLIGTDTGAFDGIYGLQRSNVEIRNGTIRDFGRHGIHEDDTSGQSYRIINIRSVSNGFHGIYLAGFNKPGPGMQRQSKRKYGRRGRLWHL